MNERNENEPRAGGKTVGRKRSERVTRRRFMKTGGAAVAAAVAFPELLAHAGASGPKKVRIGIVGGNFGRRFPWQKHPGCIVEAVSDLRPERRKALMEKYECTKSYDSLEELVKDKDIDAVGIFTDGPLHVRHTVEAMKHGKHVISAVPACWGKLEEAQLLLDTVKKFGLTYMMAETSYYQQYTISVRKFHEEGKFGEIFFCESSYQHNGLEELYFENGKRTWRHGMAPMHYPTHNTVHLVGVTGERLTTVSCQGWGDGDPILKDNVYKNPFWNESAIFKTSRGHICHINIWWKGAFAFDEGPKWVGSKTSFYARDSKGTGPVIFHLTREKVKDESGFEHVVARRTPYRQRAWYKTDMLPKPLRYRSGHGGSHGFLAHEFIEALQKD
ncbi:MAG: Gfo/Idh/MocA family oxidoreductase, partial [Planctomycetia bacterium]|nr:Gfo/Idh/MocA family oxidoreductase [Planctomycetia bacterium]